MTSLHSRSGSDELSKQSMYYILEHVLQYPGSYDIPLKTMHHLNRKDFSRIGMTAGRAGNASPVTGQFAWNDMESATMNFTNALSNELKLLPMKMSSLPPTFICSFANRIFVPSRDLVDWHQALTALDYLKDLEMRRLKEMRLAFERLHIHGDTYETDMAFMKDKFPGINLWVNHVDGKNKKAEQYYAGLYLALRKWIMIEELSTVPFNKLDCLSMLNTLFPPVLENTQLPSPLLDLQTLKAYRKNFFKLIGEVQRSGPGVLTPIIEMNRGPEHATGWPSVQKLLDKYLRVALNTIQDCIATVGPESFDRYPDEHKKEKKHDSGVSFGSERRPSVGSSLLEPQVSEQTANFAPAPKGLSKLERITREFRRMRVKPRPEVEEITQIAPRAPDVSQAPAEKKTLKKARSLASLKFGNSSSLSLASRKGSDAVPFDADQMKKHRALYESTITRSGLGHN